MRQAAAALGFAAIGACATPGIDYVASVAPGNPDAGDYRVVAVDEFYGPYGGWYEKQFEAMLQQALFEDQPWFTVALFPRQSNVEGVYEGEIDLYPVETYESYYDRDICLERDEDDKCVALEVREEVCVDFSVKAAVTPRLLDPKQLRLVHSGTYEAARSATECASTGFVEVFYADDAHHKPSGEARKASRGHSPRARRHTAGRRYPFRYGYFEHSGYIPDPDYIVDGLFRAALEDTIWQIRQDVAPYNQILRAELITRPTDTLLAADGRFQLGIDAARQGDPQNSCATWRQLAAEYPDAPDLKHNLGACAEALGDYERAQLYYAEAAEALAPFGADAVKRTNRALQRVSERRQDNVILDRIAPREPEAGS
ncbi:MAG: hypothetical protein AAFX08_09875 [Pseudomonadota bacterium]